MWCCPPGRGPTRQTGAPVSQLPTKRGFVNLSCPLGRLPNRTQTGRPVAQDVPVAGSRCHAPSQATPGSTCACKPLRDARAVSPFSASLGFCMHLGVFGLSKQTFGTDQQHPSWYERPRIRLCLHRRTYRCCERGTQNNNGKRCTFAKYREFKKILGFHKRRANFLTKIWIGK